MSFNYFKLQSERPNVLSLLNHVIMKREQEMQLYQHQQQVSQQNVPHQIQYPVTSPILGQSNYAPHLQTYYQHHNQRLQDGENHLNHRLSEDSRQFSVDRIQSENENLKRHQSTSGSRYMVIDKIENCQTKNVLHRPRYAQAEANFGNHGDHQRVGSQPHHQSQKSASISPYNQVKF